MVSSEFLASIPILASLSKQELDEMALYWTDIEKDLDEVIFKKGDPAHTIYIIREGSVRIMLRGFDGEDLTLSVLKAGELFGELTLFENKERTATAIAAEQTKLLKMSRSAFIGFIKKYPIIAINLLTVLSKRLRDSNELIERQVTRNVNEEIENEMTFADRLADKFSGFIGSWKFILVFSGILISWVLLNTYILVERPLDHYPFILLNLLLSCLAAFQAPVIMMSQGRQAKKDHIAAELDYRINLKSEWQIEEILTRLDKIARDDKAKGREQTHIKNELTQFRNEIVNKLNQMLDQPNQSM